MSLCSEEIKPANADDIIFTKQLDKVSFLGAHLSQVLENCLFFTSKFSKFWTNLHRMLYPHSNPINCMKYEEIMDRIFFFLF